MQFELDEERALLKSSTREFLEKESSLDEARSVMEDSPEGYSKALYAQLGELGYLSLLQSEPRSGRCMNRLRLTPRGRKMSERNGCSVRAGGCSDESESQGRTVRELRR